MALPFIFFKVTDLHEGHTYVFKVRAVNDAGVGKSSEISEPVLVEERPGKMHCLISSISKILKYLELSLINLIWYYIIYKYLKNKGSLNLKT